MIKIRYSDLPAGVHANTETQGRRTIIYLIPGLSATDKKNAIDRLRASARVGHGPKLPAIPLALALISDRVGQNLRNGAAAARMHPTGAAIPVIALVCGAVLYGLFVTGSIRIGPPSITGAAAAPNLPAAAASPARGNDNIPDVVGGGNGPAYPGPAGDHNVGGAVAAGATGPAGSTTGSNPTSSPTGTPTPTSGGHPTPPSGPTPSVPPNSPTPTPTPTHRHTGGGGGSGLCVNLGILGVCLG